MIFFYFSNKILRHLIKKVEQELADNINSIPVPRSQEDIETFYQIHDDKIARIGRFFFFTTVIQIIIVLWIVFFVIKWK